MVLIPSVLRIQIRDLILFDPWILDPGWKKMRGENIFGVKNT